MMTCEMPLQSTVKELKGPGGMRRVGRPSQAESRDYQAEIKVFTIHLLAKSTYFQTSNFLSRTAESGGEE